MSERPRCPECNSTQTYLRRKGAKRERVCQACGAITPDPETGATAQEVPNMGSKKAALVWPTICDSERMASLGVKGALVYTWMLARADRQGRFAGNAKRVKALVVPFMDEITAEDVERALLAMETEGLILRYTDPSTGRSLIQVADWWEYNAGAKYITASKWPPPEGWTDREPTGRDALGRFHAPRSQQY